MLPWSSLLYTVVLSVAAVLNRERLSSCGYVVALILQTEGLLVGFYKGLTPSVLKAALSSMLMFGLYDRTHAALLAATGRYN